MVTCVDLFLGALVLSHWSFLYQGHAVLISVACSVLWNQECGASICSSQECCDYSASFVVLWNLQFSWEWTVLKFALCPGIVGDNLISVLQWTKQVMLTHGCILLFFPLKRRLLWGRSEWGRCISLGWQVLKQMVHGRFLIIPEKYSFILQTWI